MKAKIYRGAKEIGGTCVELTADNGKILWIDLGIPLDEKNPNVDYAQNKLHALIISHPHQDHFGFMEKVGTEVPIYIGQLSLDLINAAKIFIDKAPLKGNFTIIKPWKSFIVADTFRIKPFLTDHSTPEAFAFLIEADGKRVFYSGDFRATGRKNIVYKKLIENPPENIDLLLMEGTMVEQTNHLYSTEDTMPQGSKLLLIEAVIPEKNIAHPGKFMDINRLVMTGGRERTATEWKDLIESAGLKFSKIIPTQSPMFSIVEAEKILGTGWPTEVH
jgi:ribonuclease J